MEVVKGGGRDKRRRDCDAIGTGEGFCWTRGQAMEGGDNTGLGGSRQGWGTMNQGRRHTERQEQRPAAALVG